MIPKFRVWVEAEETMHPVLSLDWSGIDDDLTVFVQMGHTSSRAVSIDNAILMQSTGLLDKNSVEIFEGDVVSFSIDNGWDYVVSKNGLIIYWDGCYQILENGIKYRINQCLEEDIEVIGNMYELESVEK